MIGAPILDAYSDPDGYTVNVWCDHCKAWHTHGDPAGSRHGDARRAAHCACPHSPYSGSGYVVEVVGPFTKEVREAHYEEQRAGRRRRQTSGWTCGCERGATA